MCGIAGFISPARADAAALAPMLARIAHRGPDGQGTFVEGPAALECEGEYSYGSSARTESVWNGTFYDDAVINGWEYDGDAAPKYVVRVTDSNGGVWTEEMPLVEK